MVDPINSGSMPAKLSMPSPTTVPQAPVQSKLSAPNPITVAQAPIQQDVVAQKTDTVQLSDEAQARNLRLQGKSIPEIALQLRLDVKTVNGFFPESR